jgi:hypothetical protein
VCKFIRMGDEGGGVTVVEGAARGRGTVYKRSLQTLYAVDAQ